jgi:S1-C subfamily serine protease
MTIELRVLTGARAGHRARFDGSAITIGRHPTCEFQLDTHADLAVSSRHAEVRAGADGAVVIADLGSTNGTFVNGARVVTHALRDGDVVQLGADGPKLEVRIDAPVAAARSSRSSRRWLVAAVLVAAGVGGAYLLGARRSAAEVADLRRLLAGHDSMTRALEERLRDVSDTTVLAALRRSNDSLRAVARAGAPNARADVRGEVARMRVGTTALAAVDLPAINARNAPAIAYLVSELEGRALAGTAFALTPDGVLLTNRHLVRASDGTPATRIAVKFRDRAEWRTARVVRVASAAGDDLALLRLDDAGAATATVPAVRGLAANDAALREGAAVVSIGYPFGRSTPMNGDGDDFVARTSLYPGTVSKLLPDVLQLAAFAGHGSSGSPVFDANGLVAGVVWGGARESGGQIVYAVPASRVAAFLRGAD